MIFTFKVPILGEEQLTRISESRGYPEVWVRSLLRILLASSTQVMMEYRYPQRGRCLERLGHPEVWVRSLLRIPLASSTQVTMEYRYPQHGRRLELLGHSKV